MVDAHRRLPDGRTLSDVMEFDHVIRVNGDGTVTEPNGISEPDVYWSNGTHNLEGDGWSLMNGYSGQDRYAGPVMHSSEFIGGRMADDILSTPGYYVAMVVDAIDCDDHDSPDDCDCDRNVGWAVAYKETEE